MNFSSLTKKIVERFIDEVNEPENRKHIQNNLIEPLIKYTYNRLYPYIYVIVILFLLTFILALLIFIFLLKSSVKNV